MALEVKRHFHTTAQACEDRKVSKEVSKAWMTSSWIGETTKTTPPFKDKQISKLESISKAIDSLEQIFKKKNFRQGLFMPKAKNLLLQYDPHFVHHQNDEIKSLCDKLST